MNDSQPIAKNALGGHDAPINDVADDLLGSFTVARALHRIIRSTLKQNGTYFRPAEVEVTA